MRPLINLIIHKKFLIIKLTGFNGSISTDDGASNASSCSPRFSLSIPITNANCDKSTFMDTDDKVPEMERSGTKKSY